MTTQIPTAHSHSNFLKPKEITALSPNFGSGGDSLTLQIF
jgi:hypothetical protein